jgi:hypothetical protein
VTKVAERLLQQTLGEARYKELLEQSKNDKKRKAPHQRKSHQGSEPHSKKTKSDSEPSLSSSSSSSPAKTTKAEVVVIADEGESNAEDTIQWEGALGTPVPTRTELGGQVIEILRALGIDADVYESVFCFLYPSSSFSHCCYSIRTKSDMRGVIRCAPCACAARDHE